MLDTFLGSARKGSLTPQALRYRPAPRAKAAGDVNHSFLKSRVGRLSEHFLTSARIFRQQQRLNAFLEEHQLRYRTGNLRGPQFVCFHHLLRQSQSRRK